MLKEIFLIVFAITIWEYRKEVSNSIFSFLLIMASYLSNLVRTIKWKVERRKVRMKRKSSEDGSEKKGD